MLLLPTTSLQALIRIAVSSVRSAPVMPTKWLSQMPLSHRCSRDFCISQRFVTKHGRPDPGVSFASPILVPCKELGNTSFAGQVINGYRFGSGRRRDCGPVETGTLEVVQVHFVLVRHCLSDAICHIVMLVYTDVDFVAFINPVSHDPRNW
jgi:hypothetical protein